MKPRKWRCVGLAVVTLCVQHLTVAPATATFVVADEINTQFVPSINFFWNAAEVGWVYTPDTSYELAAVATRFAGTDGRTVTLEIFDGVPLNGASLLRTTDYVPLSQTFTPAELTTPLEIVAGEEYFIGYRNTTDLNVNVAIEMEAENLPVYFGFVNSGTYSIAKGDDVFTAQPILQFLGVPEPNGALLLLLAAGCLAPFRTQRSKR